MLIKELSIAEFTEFASTHFIGNFHESINYAMFKAEDGFEYEFIGYGGIELVAAALILYKKIGSYYYGYSPRGFLIDYSNKQLLKDFTDKIKEYYKKKNFAFIKINPEIAIAKLNTKSKNFEYNENNRLINYLLECGYKKLKDNMYFESLLPRVNAIVNLDEFAFNKLSKNTKNKIKKGIRKGLTLEKVDQKELSTFYGFIKDKIDKDEFYFSDFYNVFNRSADVDFLMVSIDYKKGLINAQKHYNYELVKNNFLNSKLAYNNRPGAINSKMNSDKALLAYKNDIADASEYINKDITTYVAGALVIKYQNRIIIHVSGFDNKYKSYAPNYYLYYAILNYYQGTYKYADLNGITADLSHDGPYYGLNRFKLGFKPDIYEYIGEFDLPINEDAYNHLLKNGSLAKEFNKKISN